MGKLPESESCRGPGKAAPGVSPKSGAVRYMGDEGVLRLSQHLRTVSWQPRDAAGGWGPSPGVVSRLRSQPD